MYQKNNPAVSTTVPIMFLARLQSPRRVLQGRQRIIDQLVNETGVNTAEETAVTALGTPSTASELKQRATPLTYPKWGVARFGRLDDGLLIPARAIHQPSH